MNRFAVVGLIVVAAVGYLMYAAVQTSAKEVLTVQRLVDAGVKRERIRVGARVTDGSIEYKTKPELLLRFGVRDIVTPEKNILVEYRDAMPDTLKAGRDVILEGDYDGTVFHASSLQTQCPSKYEIPTPDGSKAEPK